MLGLGLSLTACALRHGAQNDLPQGYVYITSPVTGQVLLSPVTGQPLMKAA